MWAFWKANLGLFLLSGGLFFVAFFIPKFWFLVLAATIILIYGITKAISLKEVFLYVWFTSTAKMAGALFWVWSVYPLDWLGINPGPIQLSLIGMYWVVSSMVVGLAMALVLAVFFWLFKYKNCFLFFLPIFWVVGEILGSFFFSLYSLGPGSVPNLNFSFGYTGYSLAYLAWLYPIAALSGVYGLSFLVATLGMVSYFFLANFRNSLRIAIFPAVITLFVLIVLQLLVTWQPFNTKLEVSIVAIDTNFSNELIKLEGGKDLRARAVVEATLAASKLKPDIILLPEDSRLTRYFGSSEDTLRFLTDNVEGPILIVDTAKITNEEGKTVLRAFYYDLREGEVYMVDKQYLVPQGEFVPYLTSLFLETSRQLDLLSVLNDSRDSRIGELSGYDGFPSEIPGILFCSESVIPNSVKKISQSQESPLILHSISHAWFNSSKTLDRQLDSMLRTQAIWNGKVIVTATNKSNSQIFYPDGRIQEGLVLVNRPLWRLVEYNL